MINIKELIAMYAPTVLMAVSVIMNYLKTFKELKRNVSNIENSKVLKETNNEITELKALQMELINELKRVEKYDTDKEIQKS